MKNKKKPNVKPSLDPQVVTADRAWYYESKRGIELITQKRTPPTDLCPEGEFVSGDITRISWSKLMRSAARCGWKVSRIKRASR